MTDGYNYFSPVMSMVDTVTATVLAMLASGGMVVMATHMVRMESSSSTVAVVGNENTAAMEETMSGKKLSN